MPGLKAGLVQRRHTDNAGVIDQDSSERTVGLFGRFNGALASRFPAVTSKVDVARVRSTLPSVISWAACSPWLVQHVGHAPPFAPSLGKQVVPRPVPYPGRRRRSARLFRRVVLP